MISVSASWKKPPKAGWLDFLVNLSGSIDHKLSQEGDHSPRVAEWAAATARKIGVDEAGLRSIYWAGILHDIGKVIVPDVILTKPAALNQQEWRLMKLHPTAGSNLVSSTKALSTLAPLISSHQEKYDGSGYPMGLKGRQIPLAARVLAVADAYEAMTSQRVYRRRLNHQEAVDELVGYVGRQFDGWVVEAFLDIVGSQEHS